MIEIAYTQKRLEKCVSYKDLINDKTLLIRKNRDASALKALKKINAATTFDSDFKKIQIRGKDAYRFNNFEQVLTTRLLSKNIKINYRIRQQNRNVLVKNLISCLKESGPFTIYRFDIKNFFEAINRDEVLRRLLQEDRCSRQTITLAYEFFHRLKSQGVSGLPRGLGISSTLADYVLQDFDQKIRDEPNVFFYARFVDDLILVCAPEMNKGQAGATRLSRTVDLRHIP